MPRLLVATLAQCGAALAGLVLLGGLTCRDAEPTSPAVASGAGPVPSAAGASAAGDGGGPNAGAPRSAGTGDGGAAEAACPNLVVPALTTQAPGSGTLTEAGYGGGDVPQLDLDGPDPGFTDNDPHVLRVGDTYWMYASATDQFDYPVRLFRLTSRDGEHWQRSPAGAIRSPSALVQGDQLWLYFAGHELDGTPPEHFAIGRLTRAPRAP